MADSNILSDFGINILEEEIDDVIFQTNEFLTDATFTGSQGPFWWILQMCMALAALFSIVVAGNIAYKMMVKHEPLDVMKLFRPLAISVILCWWYPPADTGITNSGSSWCFLDFLSYIPNCIGSYTHDLYQAESLQIEDKFEEVQELIYVRDTLYTSLQAQADVAHSGTSDPNLIESTMEQTGVEEVTNMEKDASRLWFTSLTAGAVVGLDKIIMLIALIVYRIGWWATIYCQQILLGMLTIFGPIQWAFSLLPKWEGAWAKWLIRYLTVHFYGAMLYFVGFYVLLLFDIVLCIQVENLTAITESEQTMAAYVDMNNLKVINDRYGHEDGDFSLQLIGKILTSFVGDGGIVGRIGGDEFACIAFYGQKDEGEDFKRRLYEEFQNYNKSSIKKYNITVSAGIHVVGEAECETLQEALAMADLKLYEEKKLRTKNVDK